MDYFQGVVAEYLRANRATFVNPECLVQLDDNPTTPKKDGHWYINLLAVSFSEQTVYLCEVSYSTSLSPLLKKLSAWGAHWPGIIKALGRDSSIPKGWQVRPWLFVPEQTINRLMSRMPAMPIAPKVTPLEMTQPWRFCGWNRHGELEKPKSIPVDMW